jgi:hypothetical protein
MQLKCRPTQAAERFANAPPPNCYICFMFGFCKAGIFFRLSAALVLFIF